MKRKKRHCYYFCNGYCFWNGDTGEVCGTHDNQHDGYCPMEENNRELEEFAEWLQQMDEEKKKCPYYKQNKCTYHKEIYECSKGKSDCPRDYKLQEIKK